MKISKFLLIGLSCLFIAGCNLETSTRDVIAAGNGSFTEAQAKYKLSCIASPTQTICVTINKEADAINLSADLLNLYCSGPPLPGNPAYGTTDEAPCSPQKGYESRLTAAVADLNTIIADIKGAL